jgi:hypothetical protein
VKQWLRSRQEALRIFFLPVYSPELNPDELLNQDVKTNAIGRLRPYNLREMESSARSRLRRIQRRPQVVHNYFKEEHVKYAAA